MLVAVLHVHSRLIPFSNYKLRSPFCQLLCSINFINTISFYNSCALYIYIERMRNFSSAIHFFRNFQYATCVFLTFSFATQFAGALFFVLVRACAPLNSIRWDKTWHFFPAYYFYISFTCLFAFFVSK